MEKRYLKLSDISAYRKAFGLSNYVWNIVIQWDYFAKDTIGKQFVRAIDSIAANIAEGFGRYHKKDKIKFYYYSKGSTLECLNWNEMSKARNLITGEQYAYLLKELKQLKIEISTLIKFTNEKLNI